MPKPPEKPPEPIILRVNTIADGKFYMAGTPTPFSEATLPEHLQPDIVGSDEDFYRHSDRNIYNNPQPGPDPGVVYQPLSGGQWRRQAVQAAAFSQEQIYAEEQLEAANKLSPELEEVLQDSHDQHVALTKARLEANQRFIDTAYESATQEAESRTVVFHVKRGSVYVRCEKVKCKPGEAVFTKDESGEWSFVGVVDSNGEPPPQPIIT